MTKLSRINFIQIEYYSISFAGSLEEFNQDFLWVDFIILLPPKSFYIYLTAPYCSPRSGRDIKKEPPRLEFFGSCEENGTTTGKECASSP